MDKQIKEKIEYLVKEMGDSFGQPLSQSETKEMETKLNVKIPKEYREFLETFGCLEEELVLGRVVKMYARFKLETGEYLWSALGKTLGKRGYKNFPRNCIVIKDDGENVYCVVCGGKDDGKVIVWDAFCDPNQAYPNLPTREWFSKNPDWAGGYTISKKEEDFWVRGWNFWDYLIRVLENHKAEYEKYIQELKEKEKEKLATDQITKLQSDFKEKSDIFEVEYKKNVEQLENQYSEELCILKRVFGYDEKDVEKLEKNYNDDLDTLRTSFESKKKRLKKELDQNIERLKKREIKNVQIKTG